MVDMKKKLQKINAYRTHLLDYITPVFEKCIYNQLISYFSSENIITPTQNGFKPGSTTVDWRLVDLIEEISTSLDQGDYAVRIFLDLSKAFGTVNHSILYCQSYRSMAFKNLISTGSNRILTKESREVL